MKNVNAREKMLTPMKKNVYSNAGADAKFQEEN